MIEGGKLFRATYFRLMNEKNNTSLGYDKAGNETPVPRFDGGVSISGRVYKPVWDKCAAKLQSAGLDIGVYLEEVIFRLDVASPMEAVSDANIQRYDVEWSKDRAAGFQWDLQESYLLSAIRLDVLLGDSVQVATLRAVRCEGSNVSALVRYCFAVSKGYGSKVSHLRERAFREYRMNQLMLDATCSDRIPQELKEG